MNPDVMAMLAGLDRGKASLQGVMPSASNVGGAPEQVDPAAPLLDSLYRQLSDVIDYLHQRRQDHDSNKLLGALKVISGVQQERRKRFAEGYKSGDGQSGPLAGVGSLNAMGIPQG